MSPTAVPSTPLRLAPGVAVCALLGLAALAVATAAHPWAPALSPLLLAVLAGAAWRNLAPVPAALGPGVAFTAKPVLRAGIVLLGLQLSLPEVLALGPGALALVAGTVGATFAVAVLLGRALRLPDDLTLLVASGFSICGAAAVAGADSVVRARREMAASALGLVVLFGTLMIPLMPALTAALGLDARTAGLWIGASTHEVAQVVAAGGIVGPEALQTAVTVKLARVLMLAPVLAGLAWWMRRRAAAGDHGPLGEGQGAARPPLVPWFVLGFVALMLVRSTGLVPGPALEAAAAVQQLLLAAAMAALGLGVDLRAIARLGPRPLALGAGTTAAALVVGGAGALLAG
ncbi:YeiH family protein [Micrococcus sp.]|uniref:YeiH family protein n=1 Tax=Micrococcus sp. TaxID=1271 RepID=UPI0026DB8CBD|nr:putative sulfate exporter family transporter [Micrococcus sp.]MDO4238920.1 putative sulfate exporter family transporter [Micrococcus sp.]